MFLYRVDDITYEYQYDGRAPFNEIVEWCRQCCGPHWGSKNETIWIHKDDIAMFILRWS